MSRAIHVFRTPDRFVAGTVGEPGDRSFLSPGRARITGGECAAREAAGSGPRRSHGLTPRRGTSTLRNRGSATSRRRLRPQPAGHTARRGVPGRHDGARLGRRCRGGPSWSCLAVSETEFDESVVLDDADDGPDAVRVFLTPEQAREFSLRSERVNRGGTRAVPAVW